MILDILEFEDPAHHAGAGNAATVCFLKTSKYIMLVMVRPGALVPIPPLIFWTLALGVQQLLGPAVKGCPSRVKVNLTDKELKRMESESMKEPTIVSPTTTSAPSA